MQCEGSLAKRLPLGGKLSRKRLMRGDKSALAQRLQNLTHPTHQTGATAALCQNSVPPQTTKTSPKSTRAMQSETTLCHEKAGALGGSSRRVWEVGRERDASFKRRPSPSKVFLPPRSFKPSDTSPLRATRANRRRERRLTRFSRSGRRREHGNASQRSRACRLWRDSRP